MQAALLTGRYALRCGVPNIVEPAPDMAGLPNAQGFDDFFGFLSGCVDCTRLLPGRPRPVSRPVAQPDEVWENGRYMTELITREARRFVTQNRQRPFFLYVARNARKQNPELGGEIQK